MIIREKCLPTNWHLINVSPLPSPFLPPLALTFLQVSEADLIVGYWPPVYLTIVGFSHTSPIRIATC